MSMFNSKKNRGEWILLLKPLDVVFLPRDWGKTILSDDEKRIYKVALQKPWTIKKIIKTDKADMKYINDVYRYELEQKNVPNPQGLGYYDARGYVNSRDLKRGMPDLNTKTLIALRKKKNNDAVLALRKKKNNDAVLALRKKKNNATDNDKKPKKTHKRDQLDQLRAFSDNTGFLAALTPHELAKKLTDNPTYNPFEAPIFEGRCRYKYTKYNRGKLNCKDVKQCKKIIGDIFEFMDKNYPTIRDRLYKNLGSMSFRMKKSKRKRKTDKRKESHNASHKRKSAKKKIGRASCRERV